MKKILALALVTLSSANASELSFGDLNFLVPEKSFSIGVQADLRSDETQLAEITKETEGWYLDSLLSYGYSSKLNFFAGLNYQYDVEVTNEDAPSDDRYSLDGLANPLLGGVYRFVNQSESLVNVDFGLIARLKLEDQKIGSASGALAKDGNAADGRSSYEIFGRLGRKWNEANEWQVTAGLNHHLSGTSKQLATTGANSKLDDSSSTDGYLKLGYQYRPVNEFMMLFTAQGSYIGSKSIENESSQSQDLNSHLDLDFTFKAKYLVTSNLVANFTLGQGRYSNYKGENFDGSKIDIEKRRASRIGVGIDWLF
jgi:hypothetical protein